MRHHRFVCSKCVEAKCCQTNFSSTVTSVIVKLFFNVRELFALVTLMRSAPSGICLEKSECVRVRHVVASDGHRSTGMSSSRAISVGHPFSFPTT